MVDNEVLERLRSEHKRVKPIDFGNGIVVVLRAPKRHEYRRCRSAMHDATKVADAQEDLVREIVVWCSGKTGGEAIAAFDALLEDFPALCENKIASREIADFTGLEFAASGKGSTGHSNSSASTPRS